MKFKYRRLVIRSVALIMFIYISLLALSLPIGAVVDTSRGEGDDYNVTGASPFPMTVGFAFRSSDDSDYNYITATDVGGYGQEYNRTLTGTDEFTYTFDELNENTTTTRYMNYSFGNIYWSSQSLFGYRYGFQPLTLSVETQGTDEACETIVLRAPEVVFNTYAFDFYESFYNGIDEEYDIADLAYLGIPVISAPQVVGPSLSKYVGTCSIRYSVTDQHGNVKDFNYAVPYDSSVDGYIPLLKVDDLYTYYSSVDPAQNSPKILISDWYVFWDVDYYEWVDTTEPSAIDIDVYGANDNLVHTDGFDITDDIGLTFSQWASGFSQSGYSVEVLDNGVELTYTSGSDTYTGYIYNGIDRVYGSTVIAEGVTYGATLNYEEPSSTTDELAGTWVFNGGVTSSSSPSSGYSFYVTGTYNGYSTDGTFGSIDIHTIYLRNSTVTAFSGFSIEGTQQYDMDGLIEYVENDYYSDHVKSWWNDSTPSIVYYDTQAGFDVRTFTITSKLADVPNGEVLLNWLQAHGRKQGTSASAASVVSEPVATSTDTPTTIAAGEWVKVDSDKRNRVQIGYPLYDTSNGDPDYAAILNYPNFTNYLAGSTIDIPTEPGFPGDSDEDPASLTRWLGVAVSGFTDVELWPNFSIGGLLAILVSFSVVMLFLKLFAGG